jgi:hypothetical protein
MIGGDMIKLFYYVLAAAYAAAGIWLALMSSWIDAILGFAACGIMLYVSKQDFKE